MSEPAALSVTVPETAYDNVLDLLWQSAPVAISEVQLTGGHLKLTAGYARADEVTGVLELLSEFHPELSQPDQRGWLSSWRTREPPHPIANFHLRLPEHPTPTSGLIDLVIEPAATFGFSHTSTRLALKLLASLPIAGRAVADVGSGSGVLGIAAALSGAATICSVDHDPEAVVATRANAERNRARLEAHVGSVEALEAAGYDIILANMTTLTLLGLRDTLIERLATTGHLIVSGLLASQQGSVKAAFEPLEVHSFLLDGEWAAMVLTR